VPNKLDAGADVDGVEKRDEEEAGAAGVLNIKSPVLPEEAPEVPTAGCCCTLDTGIAELANNPAPWVVVCAEFAGKCKVG